MSKTMEVPEKALKMLGMTHLVAGLPTAFTAGPALVLAVSGETSHWMPWISAALAVAAVATGIGFVQYLRLQRGNAEA